MDLKLPPAIQEKFFRIVWKIVQLIPPGKVITYGKIANYIPCPEGIDNKEFLLFRARWVGHAMNACPAGVPWQRVINSQGKISYRQSGYRQKLLLEAEGVIFDIQNRVDLNKYAWEGPPNQWLKENGVIDPGEPIQLNLIL